MKKEDIKKPQPENLPKAMERVKNLHNGDLDDFFEEVNLAMIKEYARQAFRDQQLQDTEGGVPCAVSFICGFRTGYRKAQELLTKKQDQTTHNRVEIRQLQKGEDL
jgi:hypothetical protein